MATRSEPVPPRPIRLVLPLSLAFVVAVRAAWEWRFFARFLNDDAWPLRAADRAAAGEHVYTDFGWVYGPLPVWVVGLLFRIRRDVAWDSLLDSILCLAAVSCVWFVATRLTGRRTGSWITAWTALLGAPIGLVSYQMTPYTSAVAWGAATSLLAAATALAWVQSAATPALAAAFVFTVCALLSKPEFGLAGVCVFGAALWLRRPPRHIRIALAASLAVAGLIAVLGIEAPAWFAWWRGYSGYDLFDTKMVPIVVPDRVLGSLGVAACLALCLWSRTAGPVVAALGAIFVSALILRDLATRGSFPHLLPQLLGFAWTGVVPGLAWVGWRARSRSPSPGFWVACVYAITVNVRFFLYGGFCAAAAGPAAAVACLAVRERLVPRPTRIGLLALAVVMLASLQGEIDAISRPRGATRLDTPLGSIRVPPRTAAVIAALRPSLDAAPRGSLFVSGAGPAWYLLSGRQNPACFDMMIPGMGTTPPEVEHLLADLHARPPTLVIVEDRLMTTPEYSSDVMWNVLGTNYTPLASMASWRAFVADSTTALRPERSGLFRQTVGPALATQDSPRIR